jgi:hypothetical protein
MGSKLHREKYFEDSFPYNYAELFKGRCKQGKFAQVRTHVLLHVHKS